MVIIGDKCFKTSTGNVLGTVCYDDAEHLKFSDYIRVTSCIFFLLFMSLIMYASFEVYAFTMISYQIFYDMYIYVEKWYSFQYKLAPILLIILQKKRH